MGEDQKISAVTIGELRKRLNATAEAAGGGPRRTIGQSVNANHTPLTLADGLYFRNKVVNLDGYRFLNCRFDDCQLVVLSPNFDLEHCVIDSGTSINYGPGLTRVIRLYNANKIVTAANSHFAVRRHDDGTISLDDDI